MLRQKERARYRTLSEVAAEYLKDWSCTWQAVDVIWEQQRPRHRPQVQRRAGNEAKTAAVLKHGVSCTGVFAPFW